MKQDQVTIALELDSIQKVIDLAGKPLSRSEVYKLLSIDITEKTLQRRLKRLADASRIVTYGQRSGLRYMSLLSNKDIYSAVFETTPSYNRDPILSKQSLKKFEYFDAPPFARKNVSYNMSLVDNYVPNETSYITEKTRAKLWKCGKRFNKELAAGTYAKEIAQRLMIDLSFNSSRLEGNTYSKLDTEKLLRVGEAADGKFDEETVMILNHKEAILFLIENAEDLAFTPFVIRNLHQILSQDLLANSSACGQIRQKEVNISKTSYLPLNAPQQLEELFILLLRKASRIEDPFEQSFFLLIHLSYLQAFEDVNKRTARLSCNLPFIKNNLCPLSFIDVPKEDYIKTLIYFYETGDYTPALEVFIWAYQRSCDQYGVVEQFVGAIDSYRIKYRGQRKKVIGQVIREIIVGEQIQVKLEQFCTENQIENPDKFISIAIVELEQLHSGAIISLGITESMFLDWKEKFDLAK